MSIVRRGETRARPESIEELREFLRSVMPLIRSSRGCEIVQPYQSHDDPARFLMVEVWEGIESHRASVNNIPQEKLGEIRPLLTASPSGGYFDLIDRR